MTMKTVCQELLEEREADLRDARDLISKHEAFLQEIYDDLSKDADYDMNDAGNYVPCNLEARLMQKIEGFRP